MGLTARYYWMAATILGCGYHGATQPAEPVSVSVTADTVHATVFSSGTSEMVAFGVPLEVRNNGSGTASILAMFIQVREGASWRTVWSPITSSYQGIPVEPSKTWLFDAPVDAVLGGPGAPTWDNPEVDGTYRVILLIRASPKAAESRISSQSFVLLR